MALLVYMHTLNSYREAIKSRAPVKISKIQFVNDPVSYECIPMPLLAALDPQVYHTNCAH